MSPLEIIAVIVSALAVWTTTRRSLWCWPLGLASVALYGVVFLEAKLYSDMALQAVFGAFLVYGWVCWWRGKRDDGEVVVAPLGLKAAALSLVAGVLASVVLGWGMARWTDASLPYLDATLAGFSLVAQYWTARRHIENWWLWIAVDMVYVAMYVVKDLYLTAGLYAAFIVLAILGLRSWRAGTEAPPAVQPL
ncbi:nicotinamide riboside transporter PnuC [Nitrospirillum sp. BR 11164]|uniref:nicotinamide riboside transporter PnuC n=1 Tax=Nitrospirillum sp. BR 11164 TaxID=3104324 RepID=UPI002AFFD6D1|nr:nicotinamide riboside transporter PnuC [Nitrospirillum sp. BR 11164]MEA1651645.1 nicotinamide riboside transporter PnuC [Nitrospirillum sp. BR 11164]